MNLNQKIESILEECGACALDDDRDRSRVAAAIRRAFGSDEDRCTPRCPGFILSQNPYPHQHLPEEMKGFHIVHRCEDCDIFASDLEAVRHILSSFLAHDPKTIASAQTTVWGMFDLDSPGSFTIGRLADLLGSDLPDIFAGYVMPYAALSPVLADYAHYLLDRSDNDAVADVIRTQERLDREREERDTEMPFLKLLADANNALTPIGHLLEQASEACDTLSDIWDDFDQDALNDAHNAFQQLRKLLRFQ